MRRHEIILRHLELLSGKMGTLSRMTSQNTTQDETKKLRKMTSKIPLSGYSSGYMMRLKITKALEIAKM